MGKRLEEDIRTLITVEIFIRIVFSVCDISL